MSETSRRGIFAWAIGGWLLVSGCAGMAATNRTNSGATGSAARRTSPDRPSSRSSGKRPTDAPPPVRSEQGLASYYADSLAGNRTASGERYDPRALTAANRTLPFGTKVRVTREDNGRSVIVRINDRGPFGKKKRIIDVSRAAAETLDMIRAGVVRVRIEIVERAP